LGGRNVPAKEQIMTIRASTIGLEFPTILTPVEQPGGFQGWGVRIG